MRLRGRSDEELHGTWLRFARDWQYRSAPRSRRCLPTSLDPLRDVARFWISARLAPPPRWWQHASFVTAAGRLRGARGMRWASRAAGSVVLIPFDRAAPTQRAAPRLEQAWYLGAATLARCQALSSAFHSEASARRRVVHANIIGLASPHTTLAPFIAQPSPPRSRPLSPSQRHHARTLYRATTFSPP